MVVAGCGPPTAVTGVGALAPALADCARPARKEGLIEARLLLALIRGYRTYISSRPPAAGLSHLLGLCLEAVEKYGAWKGFLAAPYPQMSALPPLHRRFH